MNNKRSINPSTEIIPQTEEIEIANNIIACYGKDVNSPHPCVYINVNNKNKKAKCGYCGITYIKIDKK